MNMRFAILFYHQSELPTYRYSSQGVCKDCQRWFNVKLTDPKVVTHSHIHMACPHCSVSNQVKVDRTPECVFTWEEIRNGRDPVFGLELYYLETVSGKPVWALNREHLDYLISYIAADLREGPLYAEKTASYSVPKNKGI
ncbi:hypothetical protein [Paenibacillus donghaensis]|uniref:Uncharacterized protein n=1 Tax=Paenibacillus donghaensis TaxID=414771 RepID=A0A2Z2KJL6_9BACL|nr:hypothetical protein [Paenibacillus donghaensis]ASA22509.1 hypothetical protein B9T62_18005 [Paenibacillus donghaensis]